MASLLILVPISLVLLGLAIGAFVWAVRGGQYDDLDTPAIDILRNDPIDADASPSPDPAKERSDAD
jgi:cbb3-type cytochrome oxidase maturation protein